MTRFYCLQAEVARASGPRNSSGPGNSHEYPAGPVHHVSVTESGLESALKYVFTVQQEVSWLRDILDDSRLMQALKVMCQQVMMCRIPYAPQLALNYQLGGRFKFPRPEDIWVRASSI